MRKGYLIVHIKVSVPETYRRCADSYDAKERIFSRAWTGTFVRDHI